MTAGRWLRTKGEPARYVFPECRWASQGRAAHTSSSSWLIADLLRAASLDGNIGCRCAPLLGKRVEQSSVKLLRNSSHAGVAKNGNVIRVDCKDRYSASRQRAPTQCLIAIWAVAPSLCSKYEQMAVARLWKILARRLNAGSCNSARDGARVVLLFTDLTPERLIACQNPCGILCGCEQGHICHVPQKYPGARTKVSAAFPVLHPCQFLHMMKGSAQKEARIYEEQLSEGKRAAEGEIAGIDKRHNAGGFTEFAKPVSHLKGDQASITRTNKIVWAVGLDFHDFVYVALRSCFDTGERC